MQRKKICIIGCGTYGAYLLKKMVHAYGEDIDIEVIEIGDEKIRSEEEIGLRSRSENSTVANSGRYFGLGGTSARWGGQILFFDERDNPESDPVWREIVRINKTHHQKVVRQLLGSNFLSLGQGQGNIKQGIWLKYRKRNLYKQLKPQETSKVNIHRNLRVVDFVMEGRQVRDVICKDENDEFRYFSADVFYLTAGALESCRLLMMLSERYGILKQSDLGKNFGDHLSVELFRIYGARPVINGCSFLPFLHKGSLITKRMIVYSKSGRVGYVHPIFNKDVSAFSTLKRLLFGRQQAKISIAEIFQSFGFLLKFSFNIFLRKKMYVHKNNWSLQLDIEQPFPNNNTVSLSEDTDAFQEPSIKIDWEISKTDREAIKEISDEMRQLLKENYLPFSPVYLPGLTTSKIEDIYHPVGCIRIGTDEKAVVDFDNRVNGTDNLYHFSTAIFPSARSINPTAAVFCFIEHHMDLFDALLQNEPSEKVGEEFII